MKSRREEIYQFLIQSIEERLSAFRNTQKEDISDITHDDDTSTDFIESNMETEIANVTLSNETIDQLALHLEEIKSLSRGTSGNGHIKKGNIIETVDKFLIVGTTFTPITYQDKKLLGIAHDAPVYEKVLGLAPGDTLTVNDRDIKIEAIY
ncbi:hypothetical protein [Algivirga pacifica]|uniref:Transcription elongation factor GreA/GreB C-terminal domain-containing protein n=1 Tax=Algivirga pacifica TaxID=1162670 RepID=A0ABP9DMS1_9BACT